MNTYLCGKGRISMPCLHCCAYGLNCCLVWGHALRASVRSVQGICMKHGKKMDEPDYSVAFTVGLADWLSISLPSHWPSNVSVGGCYVHQSPWVSHLDSTNKSVYCEAGDVLLICRKSGRDYERYNAALLQLKMVTGSAYQVSKDKEERQLHVYEDWPELYLGQSAGVGKKFDIVPKAITPGAQYLFVNDNNPLRFTLAAPEKNMSTDGLGYSRFLCDFINWNTGRPIACQDRADEDAWSSFIWAMLQDIKNKPFTRSRAGFPKRTGRRMPQALEDLCFLQQGQDNQTIDELLLTMKESDERGMGVLFFEMREEGEPRLEDRRI